MRAHATITSYLVKRLLIAAALSLALAANADADTGKVLIHCRANLSQRAAVDPILDYGIFPTHHDHTPAGAMAFSSTSTLSQMLAAPTSCDTRADHSMLWVPTPLTSKGKPATLGAFDYYMFNLGNRIRHTPPDGLRFVAGNADCTGLFCPAIYICHKVNGTIFAKHTIPTRRDGCDTRNGLGYDMIVYSGQCWEGTSLGQGMGDSTPASNITSADPCPGQVIPGIQLALGVAANGLGGHLSSDIRAGTTKSSPGSTGHFDYVLGWTQNSLTAIIDHCLNAAAFTPAQVSCYAVQDGDGASTVYQVDPRTGYPNYAKYVAGQRCERWASGHCVRGASSQRKPSRRDGWRVEGSLLDRHLGGTF